MMEDIADTDLHIDPLEGSGSEEPRRLYRRRLTKQLCLVMVGSLGHFCVGSTQTWPSPALHDLATNNQTLLNTALTLTLPQKDMTGSMLFVGSLAGSWLAGWASWWWGRRRVMQGVAAPFIAGWIMLGLASSPPVLITARFMLGAAAGTTTVTGTMYVLELADAELRGTMSVLLSVNLILGCQFTLWMGMLFPWHYLSFVCAIPPVIVFFAFFGMPESPSYLVVHNRIEEAAVILSWLRGRHAKIGEEIMQLRNQNVDYGKTGGYRGLLNVKIVKSIAVVLCLFVFQQLSGNFVLIVQTTRVLKAAGVGLDPDISSGVAVAARLVGALLMGCCLIDGIGRRPCLIISHVINAVSLVVLGTYVYLRDDSGDLNSLSWVPMVCVGVCLFGGDIGLHSIPFILSAEYFPTTVRTQASAVCMTFHTVAGFTVVQLYGVMQAGLTQAGLYWFYAAASCVAVIFIFTAVTETKGRPIG